MSYQDIQKVLNHCPENIKKEWEELTQVLRDEIYVNWYVYQQKKDFQLLWINCPYLYNDFPYYQYGQFFESDKKTDKKNREIITEIKTKFLKWKEFVKDHNKDVNKFEFMDKLEKYISLSFRPKYLLELLQSPRGDKLTDYQVWYVIEHFWTLGENTSNDWWTELFSIRKVPEEFKKELPEEMTVFRGGDPRGISWTLDGELGQWFAERYGFNQRYNMMRIKKDDVLFYTNLRKEKEVIIIPQKHHKIVELGYNPQRERII